MKLSKQLDEYLLDLAWSLWTELGVAGLARKHQQYLILPEELILLTAALGKVDPRLRDEALDWCSRYHKFISVTRLKTLAKAWGDAAAFSLFAATLNSVSSAKWPVFQKIAPLKYRPSGKSELVDFDCPALFAIRLRALFGTGSRADLMTFFFAQEDKEFSIAATVEIGYSKRNLADMLEGFAQSGIFTASMALNQRRYRFARREEFAELVGPLPKVMFPWRQFLEAMLKIRECVCRNEDKSEELRTIALRNVVLDLDWRRLELTPPPLQENFWTVCIEWILDKLRKVAQGKTIAS